MGWLKGILKVGFKCQEGSPVDLTNPLAGQAKPLTDLSSGVSIEVNRKEHASIPGIKKLAGEVTGP